MADVKNSRLARIYERTLWWHFKIIHIPEKLQLAADNLSRRKSKLPANLYRLSAKDSEVVEEDIIDYLQLRLTDLYDCSAKIHSVMRGVTVKVIAWERLYEGVHEDQVLVKLMEVVLRGFPQSSHDVDKDLKQHQRFRYDLLFPPS